MHYIWTNEIASVSPELKTISFIDKANREYESATTSDRSKIAKRTGCKGTYASCSLSGHDRLLDTPVDPMHLIKNIGDHIIELLAGNTDSIKVCLEEEKLGRFKGSGLRKKSSTEYLALSEAPYTLSKEEKVVANKQTL